MKKIPKKHSKLITSALMSIFMAFFMTGIVTVINFNGFPSNYFQLWMTAFSTMVFVAFGVMMLIRPMVEKIVKKITK